MYVLTWASVLSCENEGNNLTHCWDALPNLCVALFLGNRYKPPALNIAACARVKSQRSRFWLVSAKGINLILLPFPTALLHLFYSFDSDVGFVAL